MTRWGAAVCVFLLAGCAGTGDGTRDGGTSALATPLIAGMAQIRDKAIDPPDLDRLFLAGLNHLSAIEPNLRADLDDNDVSLRLTEVTLARAPRPRAQDIAGWSDTVQSLVTSARKNSTSLSDADSEMLLQALYDGVMPLLDPYSRYYGRREAKRNQNARNGFVGLGFELEPVPLGAVVRQTVADGPADRAGILPGDIITRAQGRKLAKRALPEIQRSLEGPRDSRIILALARDGKELQVTVRRALIIPDTVASDLQDGVLYLAVKSFNQRTSTVIADKVNAAGPLRGLIIDLRGDPGGLLDQAVSVADLFLEHGVIATLRGRHPGAMQFYAATPGDIAAGVPMVLLVDGRSASAAEILAAALQDNGRAFAVGTATVGKGTVQTIVPLPNGGEFALTWSRAFTPSGVMLAGRGILPNLCTAGAPKSAADLIATALKAGPRPAPVAEVVRATCRPETHGTEGIDLEVARRLIAEPALRLALRPRDDGQIATTH